MEKQKKDKKEIGTKLGKLEAIVAWFEAQEEVDVEEGLKRVREGAALVKDLKERMKGIENEFEEIKKDLSDNAA